MCCSPIWAAGSASSATASRSILFDPVRVRCCEGGASRYLRFLPAARAFFGNERTNGAASRNLLGRQTMGRHRLRHPGLRPEAEEPIRYRGFPVMGRRRAGQHARPEVAQCGGLRDSDFRRPQALSGTAPKSRTAAGERFGLDRSGIERNRLEGDGLADDELNWGEPETSSYRGAETAGAKIRHADRTLARKIRAPMARSYQAVTTSVAAAKDK